MFDFLKVHTKKLFDSVRSLYQLFIDFILSPAPRVLGFLWYFIKVFLVSTMVQVFMQHVVQWTLMYGYGLTQVTKDTQFTEITGFLFEMYHVLVFGTLSSSVLGMFILSTFILIFAIMGAIQLIRTFVFKIKSKDH